MTTIEAGLSKRSTIRMNGVHLSPRVVKEVRCGTRVSRITLSIGVSKETPDADVTHVSLQNEFANS